MGQTPSTHPRALSPVFEYRDIPGNGNLQMRSSWLELYSFGEEKKPPMMIQPEQLLTKKAICSHFHENPDCGMYLAAPGARLLPMHHSSAAATVRGVASPRFYVIFDSNEIFQYQPEFIEHVLKLMGMFENCRREKSKLPILSGRKPRKESKYADFYKIGDAEPTLSVELPAFVDKYTLSAAFDQPILSRVHVFYESNHCSLPQALSKEKYATSTDAEFGYTCEKAGKYYVVFEGDPLFTESIESLKYAILCATNEKVKKKREKNQKKTARKKIRKQVKKVMGETNSLVDEINVTTSEEEPEPEPEPVKQPKASKKREKKKKAEVNSSSQGTKETVENRQNSQSDEENSPKPILPPKLVKDMPTAAFSMNPSSFMLQKAKNNGLPAKFDALTFGNSKKLVEEPEPEPTVLDNAVVVGIHPKGLIVQTIPPLDEQRNSEFCLLDMNSRTDGHSLISIKPTPEKLIHVFIKVLGLAALPENAQIVDNITNNNKNKEKDKGKEQNDEKPLKITYRVTDYMLDESDQRTSFLYPSLLHPFHKRQATTDPMAVMLVVEPTEDKDNNLIRVVGRLSRLSLIAQLDKNRLNDQKFEEDDFILTNYIKGKPFYKLRFLFGTLCLIKSYTKEKDFQRLKERNEGNFQEYVDCLRMGDDDPELHTKSILLQHFPHTNDGPEGDAFLYNMQKLSSEQSKLVSTCCRELKSVEYEKARLFIRDPAIAICRFQGYQAYKNAKLFTIDIQEMRIWQERGCNYLKIDLDEEEASKVLRKDSPWREGTELKIWNKILEREVNSPYGLLINQDANVVIDTIEKVLEEEHKDKKGSRLPFSSGSDTVKLVRKAKVKLRPLNDSKDLVDIIKKFKKGDLIIRGETTIGPSPIDGAMNSLCLGFDKFHNFYRNTRFFNRWRGWQEKEENEDYCYLLQERVQIPQNIRLDISQSAALQHSFHREGITSVQAPPGSGKTLLIAALAVRSRIARPADRMVVTATTNMGVNNAVDKMTWLDPNYSISREMSKKGEEDVTEDMKKYSLRHQALESRQSHPLLLQIRREYQKVLAYYKNAATLREKLNRLEMLHYAESKVKQYYLRCVVPYCVASTPSLLIRHSEHYNMVFGDNVTLQRSEIKHLVVDEASQLSYYQSLAICCVFPHLERVTVLGDRKQLGPYCRMESHFGLLKNLSSLSELDRIHGSKTSFETFLNSNYRSHPWIVENILQPVYGPSFKPALSWTRRTLAHKLPLFECQSPSKVNPVAFINIEPGADCHNESERNGVVRLLNCIAKKKISLEKVSILCFHRKQKEELEKNLKDAFPNEMKKKTLTINTIDSFQGRENQIIVVCTTKSCNEMDHYYESLFKFVADPRRGIVALSRAQEAMYVFGQWEFLGRKDFWKAYKQVMREELRLFNHDWTLLAV